MRRNNVSKGKSRKSFVSRAGKTDKMNLSQPRRGGWRL